MLVEILRFAALIAVGFFAIVVFSVMFTVLNRGPANIAELARKGVRLRTWAVGDIPENRDGTSIDIIEGIEIAAKGRSLVTARQTRGISAEH